MQHSQKTGSHPTSRPQVAALQSLAIRFQAAPNYFPQSVFAQRMNAPLTHLPPGPGWAPLLMYLDLV